MIDRPIQINDDLLKHLAGGGPPPKDCGLDVEEIITELAQRALKSERLIRILEHECCDLRCIDVPTGGDDSDIEWQVVEHHQAEPTERVIARGKDPMSAMQNAFMEPPDPMQDPKYLEHMKELAEECKCADAPCDGCMAGAPCDADTYGDGIPGWSLYARHGCDTGSDEGEDHE